MDEEINIINSNSRIEKIKNFLLNNKKKIIILFSLIVLLILAYVIYDEINKKKIVKLSNNYNSLMINYQSGINKDIELELIKIIEAKDKTYSPLALYFVIDNKIIISIEKINKLFDILIKDTQIDKEIKNLLIYKKALYNSEFKKENDLLKILNPIINSDSIWKPQSLYLLAEYFLSKNEKQKAKEFYEKILTLDNNINNNIKLKAQKRINRDFSE